MQKYLNLVNEMSSVEDIQYLNYLSYTELQALSTKMNSYPTDLSTISCEEVRVKLEELRSMYSQIKSAYSAPGIKGQSQLNMQSTLDKASRLVNLYNNALQSCVVTVATMVTDFNEITKDTPVTPPENTIDKAVVAIANEVINTSKKVEVLQATEKKDNTLKYLIIGGAGLLAAGILVYLIKK